MEEKLQSETVNELFSALSKAQGEIKGAIKDGNNPHFKSMFASLSSCWEACREPLSKNGLSVVQSPSISNGINVLVTTLGHTSGQWIKSICPLIVMKNDAQGYGAACTYFRRFSLCAMVGICPEDDDGNSISISPTKKDAHHSQQQSCYAMTLEQVNEIDQLLTQCSPDFVQAHHAFLRNTLKVDSMSLVDSRYYNEFKSHALKNIETTKAKVVTLEDKNPPSVFDVKDTALAAKELHDKKEAVLKELKEKKIENAKFGK